jgi:hypothetical protein
MYGELEVYLPSFFTSALDGGERTLYPRRKDVHWIGGSLDTRASLDAVE